ncbi:anaphase-promoting complex subunit 10 isoform X1 [Hydra vulgaris]|nr:anaphase-promoting complex subunit 10-like [Hydra vulgaris]
MADDSKINTIPISSIFSDDLQDQVREIGENAVWSLSSCKPGFGVSELRDNKLTTYFQSDGPQPHLINIQFPWKQAVRFVSIYTDYKSDESYTPNRISIRVGNDKHDLKQKELLELDEPCGWINVELDNNGNTLKTFMIQIAVLGNHQNGRDTHLRQIKVFAPKVNSTSYKIPSIEQLNDPVLTELSCIR